MTSAHVSRAGTAQRIAWLGGSVHHIVLDGDATAGRLAALRSSMPAGTASPVHVHDHDDETVFVLSGGGVVWAGPDRWELGPGDTAFLPRGLPHAYRFTSTAEILTICNPAGMEGFFRTAGRDLTDPDPDGWAVDLTTLAAAAAARGQTVLGPPLGPDDAMPVGYLEP